MTAPVDPVAALAALRAPGAAGAPPFDPVRLHYLEALARRAQGFDGAVKQHLEDKLRQALAHYQTRQAAHALAAKELRRPPDTVQPGALATLTRQLAAQSAQPAEATVGGRTTRVDAYPELQSVRKHRDTWSKLSVDRQLTQALAQAPGNAGPLNSHQLVLRSLSVMRDLSPDYLNRFMSYVDALLWLDQADSQPVAASAVAGDAAKKRKPSRPRSK